MGGLHLHRAQRAPAGDLRAQLTGNVAADQDGGRLAECAAVELLFDKGELGLEALAVADGSILATRRCSRDR